ncbi:MAG: glycosyl hydrolase repeat-containing glycosyl hydrolase, partial [Paenibacillaceae bacterium]|nr:glycosyl hydrolase repeat-containing glycosyl hydrolase [Paenibacillaceae bacterium]
SGDAQPASVSPIRLVRPGHVPGTVINYIHPEDYTFNFSGRSPASPSIAELPDGRWVASHDVYWGKGGQNLSFIFRSEDQGKTWVYVTALSPCFWGKLFVHQGSLYMLATSTEYGDVLIGRSDDGGESWSAPTIIIAGGSREKGGPHKAPMPVIAHNGRLWSAVEYGSHSLGGHAAGIVSVPEDADLLEAASWTATPFLPYDSSWPGTIVGGDKPGVLEGNAVVRPDGQLVNILRYNTRGGTPDYGRAIVLSVNAEEPGAPLIFDRVIDFHGNMSKFSIRYDAESGRYWSLVNRVNSSNVNQRNILTLVSSADTVNWTIHRDILNYEENGWPEDSKKVGFQYVDWMFQGDDLAVASRTAINGAYNHHNANYLTFHRVERFREQ